MSEFSQAPRSVVTEPKWKTISRKARWPFWSLVLGLVAGTWVGGGPDRYGEDESFVGGVRGAVRTMGKSFQYTAATFRDCLTFDRASVRMLGLAQQVETRIWQDKRLVADGIIVQVEDGGTAVLKGLVADAAHKDRAVSLARDTRGVERVVDELAIRPSARTIDAVPAAAVPTGVASNPRTLQ